MTSKTFNQEFQGYWREPNIGGISNEAGVYAVYRCVLNEDNTLSIKELLYIGKGDKLLDRISGHELWETWRNSLLHGEELCFCYTLVGTAYNERVEAALINSNQPRLNVEYKTSFPFDKTIVNCSGHHEFIANANVVDRH